VKQTEEVSANSIRRKATRRDLPALCLMYAVISAFACFGLPLASKLDMAKETDLHSVTGTLLSAPKWITGRGAHLDISLVASDGPHHFALEDSSRELPLRASDKVALRVYHSRIWGIERNGVTIVSYQDTYRHMEGLNARSRQMAHWAGGISLVLFVLAALLRKHFGAWRDKRQSVAPDAGAGGE
jgi:hypothetical protein